jgi:type I restriction enzyme S subunit
MENRKTPEVRFKGFSEEWNDMIFDNIFMPISNNTLSRDNLNYKKGKGKNVHYGDVLIKFNNILDVQKDEIPFVSDDEIVQKLKPANLNNGDIIFADAAEDEIVGKCVEINNIKNEVVFAGLHTIAVRPKIEFAEKYLGYYLNSKFYHNQFLKLMQGTKVLSISKTAIKTTNLNYPKDKKEQTKIGSFFENLDQLISQHQTQHKKLNALKKAMLSKLFPKQGQTVPEIRFKGFAGDWEEKKLYDLTTYSNGKGHENEQSSSGKFELINLNSISIKGGLKPSGKFINNANETLLKNDLVMILSDVGYGDLLGRVAIIPKSNTYVLNQRVALLRPNNIIYPKFLYYNINYNQSYFKSAGAGMSQLNLSKKSVENFECLIPNMEEQKIIATYFQNLDSLIENHHKQIEKLSVLKKACLSKMFM